MRIDNIEVEEYIPVEGIPTDCANSGKSRSSKLFNLAMLVKERQFEYWAKLDIHWIFSTMKWWRWN